MATKNINGKSADEFLIFCGDHFTAEQVGADGHEDSDDFGVF